MYDIHHWNLKYRLGIPPALKNSKRNWQASEDNCVRAVAIGKLGKLSGFFYSSGGKQCGD